MALVGLFLESRRFQRYYRIDMALACLSNRHGVLGTFREIHLIFALLLKRHGLRGTFFGIDVVFA